jgi:16S rRNA G527 N7-methylase RsmG
MLMAKKFIELIPEANEMLNLLAIRGIDEEISEVILWVPNRV